MLIVLSQWPRASFLQALEAGRIHFRVCAREIGVVQPMTRQIELGAASSGRFSRVLFGWLQSGPLRELWLTLTDGRTVDLSVFSIEQFEWILPSVLQVSVAEPASSREARAGLSRIGLPSASAK